LHEHERLLFTAIPDTMEVVDSLAIFIKEKRRRFSIAGFYPIWEQSSLVCFIP
jgi:hypothetical protein